MNLEKNLFELINITPIFIMKPFIIILLLLHLIFSIVVVRQTKLMLQVIEAQLSSVIFSVAVTHLLMSFFVLVWTIIFLN